MKPPGAVRLFLHPVTLREADAFIRQFHRHRQPSRGAKFAIGCAKVESVVPGVDFQLTNTCGVVVVGRPVSRQAQADGYTAEVTRLCTDGTRNACSLLYAAAWRACRAMGYRRLITYTLASEPGISLLASGFKVVGEVAGRSWNCPSRPRVDLYPRQGKLRWELTA